MILTTMLMIIIGSMVMMVMMFTLLGLLFNEWGKATAYDKMGKRIAEGSAGSGKKKKAKPAKASKPVKMKR